MTVPPDDGPEKGHEPEPPLDFDPYRFGQPTHPIAPEYAPPGYRPPPPPTGPPYPFSPTTPPPPPPPGYTAYGPHATNTKATIAMVLGILALLFCWLSFLDLVLIVPAIVLGALGRGDSARFPDRRGRGAATSGLVCGIVAGVLAVAATVYIYQRIKPCVDEYNSSSQAYKTCVTDRLTGG